MYDTVDPRGNQPRRSTSQRVAIAVVTVLAVALVAFVAFAALVLAGLSGGQWG